MSHLLHWILFGVAFVGGQEEPLLVVGLLASAFAPHGGRLTGDPVCFRVEESWLALEMPVEQQPPLRAKLEALCAQRESRLTD